MKRHQTQELSYDTIADGIAERVRFMLQLVPAKCSVPPRPPLLLRQTTNVKKKVQYHWNKVRTMVRAVRKLKVRQTNLNVTNKKQRILIILCTVCSQFKYCLVCLSWLADRL